MKNEKPDAVVYSATDGYVAHKLPYGSNVGAPAIVIDNLVSWKSRGIEAVNKEFAAKFDELKFQYQQLMEEYEWNELLYNAVYSFEPVVGEKYHLYRAENGSHFLSLIGPEEWNKEHIGSFTLNSDKKWVMIK